MINLNEYRYLIVYHKEDNDGLFSMAIIYNYLHYELKVPKEEIVLFGTEYEKLKTVDLDEMISSFDKIPQSGCNMRLRLQSM